MSNGPSPEEVEQQRRYCQAFFKSNPLLIYFARQLDSHEVCKIMISHDSPSSSTSRYLLAIDPQSGANIPHKVTRITHTFIHYNLITTTLMAFKAPWASACCVSSLALSDNAIRFVELIGIG